MFDARKSQNILHEEKCQNSVHGMVKICNTSHMEMPRCCQKERSGKQHLEEIQECFMTAFEGNNVTKHRMENVAGCRKLMDRHMLSSFFTK